MSTALLIAAIVVSVSFCPLMMWWSSRRGRSAPCCAPEHDERPPTLDDLRRRHMELGALIAEHDAGDRPAEISNDEQRTGLDRTPRQSVRG
jgi:hypothetical protein